MNLQGPMVDGKIEQAHQPPNGNLTNFLNYNKGRKQDLSFESKQNRKKDAQMKGLQFMREGQNSNLDHNIQQDPAVQFLTQVTHYKTYNQNPKSESVPDKKTYRKGKDIRKDELIDDTSNSFTPKLSKGMKLAKSFVDQYHTVIANQKQTSMLKVAPNSKSTMQNEQPSAMHFELIQDSKYNTEKRRGVNGKMIQTQKKKLQYAQQFTEVPTSMTFNGNQELNHLIKGICLQPNIGIQDMDQSKHTHLNTHHVSGYRNSLDTKKGNYTQMYISNNPNNASQRNNQIQVVNQDNINNTVTNIDMSDIKQKNFFKIDNKKEKGIKLAQYQLPHQKCNTATGVHNKNVDNQKSYVYLRQESTNDTIGSSFKSRRRQLVNHSLIKQEQKRHIGYTQSADGQFNLVQFKQYINQLVHGDHRRHYQDKLHEVQQAQENINRILNETGLISSEGKRPISNNQVENHKSSKKIKSQLRQHNDTSELHYNKTQQQHIKNFIKKMLIPNKDQQNPHIKQNGINPLTEGLSHLSEQQLFDLLQTILLQNNNSKVVSKQTISNQFKLDQVIHASKRAKQDVIFSEGQISQNHSMPEPDNCNLTDDDIFPFKKGQRKISSKDNSSKLPSKLTTSFKSKSDPYAYENYQQFKNSQQCIVSLSQQNKQNMQHSETNGKEVIESFEKPKFVQISQCPVSSSSNVTKRQYEENKGRLLSPQMKETNKNLIESSRFNSIDNRHGGRGSKLKLIQPQLVCVSKKQKLDKSESRKSQSEMLQTFASTKKQSIQPSQTSEKKIEENNKLISYPDFDIEYAKLIAKQFPIYDENNKVIDYSNINEYQLELLALHEDYGEEKDPKKKMEIFKTLKSMDQDTFYANKIMMSSLAMKNHIEVGQNFSSHSQASKFKKIVAQRIDKKNPIYGPNVGKEGGNPQYRKTVIQLEQERIERERQEMILKRKRNSNYIQKCIKLGNEHYNHEKLSSLNWMKKQKDQNEEVQDPLRVRLDDKNYQILRKKQEILAKYNQISSFNRPEDDGTFKYNLIRGGNNSAIVTRVLRTRSHWSEMEQKHLTLFNFKWAPVSRHINYELLNNHGQKKLVNHLERHDMLTTKDQLYLNMHKFCESQKLNVFQYLPIQFILDLSLKSLVFEIDRFCQYFNCIERIKSQNISANEGLKEINQQIMNNKWINPDLKFKNIIMRKYNLVPSLYNNMNVWLIKPNDFNRGRGVMLFNSLEQLRKLLREYSNSGNETDFQVHNAISQIHQNEKNFANRKNAEEQHPKLKKQENKIEDPPQAEGHINLQANVKSEVYVIQKYIERPLLIDNRKFDIRLWVLINMVDLKDTKCYLYSEGYVRTSSFQFQLTQETFDQPLIHLTNNAVQQFDTNYGKHEEGNQLSFERASDIMLSHGINIDLYKFIETEVQPIIEMTLKCVDNGKLNPNQRRNTFEIMGYDFMIDEDLKPWLIEVNTNPCLEETSMLLRQILPRMIDDAFKLTIDVAFPAPCQSEGKPQQHFPVQGYGDHENLWKHIYTMKPQ